MQTTKGRKYPRITVGMTDRDVVERFADLMGCGAIYEQSYENTATPHWKTKYAWMCTKTADCRRILELFLPHLGHRRAHKALDLLELSELTD